MQRLQSFRASSPATTHWGELASQNVDVRAIMRHTARDQIPAVWTDGTHRWHDVLARAHSYREHITQYEARVLLRCLEIVVRIDGARRAHASGGPRPADAGCACDRGSLLLWAVRGLVACGPCVRAVSAAFGAGAPKTFVIQGRRLLSARRVWHA